MSQDLIDVAIIGGGPAGLTAANTLARQRHSAVVFDSRTYRNVGVAHMHMILTWDHKDPEEYRAAARANILANYTTIQFADVAVEKIEQGGDNDLTFRVHAADGKVWNARKIILAIGSASTYPDIEGYEALWRKRIYHCLFCHGYEDRDAPSSGVLAVAPTYAPVAAHMAYNAAQLTDKVTLYTNGDVEVEAELQSAVSAMVEGKFELETRQISRLSATESVGGDSVMVEFTDGTSKVEKFLAHMPHTKPQSPFAEQLGLEMTTMGDILAEGPFYKTSAAGVYAVGDCSTPYKVTPSAITSGCNAAVAVSAELQAAKYSK